MGIQAEGISQLVLGFDGGFVPAKVFLGEFVPWPVSLSLVRYQPLFNLYAATAGTDRIMPRAPLQAIARER